jgi:phospholipid/cholesterol/gamma-HCH transport system substrate-binding protein
VQKQAPSLGRILVMVGFALSCFGLLLFLWLAFGGSVPLKPKGYRFHVAFKQAGQLAQEADVRISGVTVGKVKQIEPDKATGTTDATIELQERYAPLPKDAKAVLRQKTLLGETYVELTPGHDNAGTIPEGGRLASSRVSGTVELDAILRAFDAPTRRALQIFIQQTALASQGRGRDLSDAIGTFAPFEQDLTTLLRILDSQQADVRGVVRDTGAVLDALTARDGQLRSLVQNGDRVFATTARRNAELAATFRALPTFERESTLTVRRLQAFARTANPLVTQLRPAARQLSPTLQQLGALAPDLQSLFHDLNPAISASKAGLPALERFLDELRPFLGSTDAPLRQLNPALAFLGGYKRELTSFFANAAASTQATGPAGATGGTAHYLRTTNPAAPDNLAAYPRRIGTNRANAYTLPGVFTQLARGLPSYETRQCGRGVPTLDQAPNPYISATLGAQVQQFFFAPAGRATAPPCRQQPNFTFQGRSSQFPQIRAATGPTAAP